MDGILSLPLTKNTFFSLYINIDGNKKGVRLDGSSYSQNTRSENKQDEPDFSHPGPRQEPKYQTH